MIAFDDRKTATEASGKKQYLSALSIVRSSVIILDEVKEKTMQVQATCGGKYAPH